MDGTPVEYVALLDKTGENLCRLGFSSNDGGLMLRSYWGQLPLGEGTIDETYENVSEVEGVLMPMIIHQSLNGQDVFKIELTNYKINPDIPEDAFEKPTP
jgi:hypothetical protein